MALRVVNILKVIRNKHVVGHNVLSTSSVAPKFITTVKQKEHTKPQEHLTYLDDPDTFGTLSGRIKQKNENKLVDEDDIKEEQFIQNQPLKSQKLTTKQYADIIKQYLEHKRLKEALDVLETKMLKEDRVKPENYIYNILIGACADVGYTRKAFKLFNDMKRRALRPTGDTYTCLFQACINSPWPEDGLKHAKHLRELMVEKSIEPNLTNYNVMIKAFGRCGDIAGAFQIVDEMISKKIKIRVHTFNHLLHACINDKDHGMRHALIVWRKMLAGREKPNIFSFNLMLKCAKECNIGSKEDIQELIGFIIGPGIEGKPASKTYLIEKTPNTLNSRDNLLISDTVPSESELRKCTEEPLDLKSEHISNSNNKELTIRDDSRVSLEFINKVAKPIPITVERNVPNLLSKTLNMDKVLMLQEIHTPQDRFAIIGGQDDFLKEMDTYLVKPDVKTFTQMLFVLDNTKEAENKLMETMRDLKVKADIDFYNMLIKKRCMRSDYAEAINVKKIIKEEDEFRKRRYRLSKKHRVKPNIMTYGVLALACNTKELAEKLLCEMQEEQYKINAQILGTLLRHGTASNDFDYIMHIMKTAQEQRVQLNEVFLKHLESFINKCRSMMRQGKNSEHKSPEGFVEAYQKFLQYYKKWLKDVNIEEGLQTEHPWQQFRENYPETVQRQNIEIKIPKKFFKRNRRFVPYKT